MYDRRVFRRLVGYLKPYRGVVGASVVCLLAHSVLQTAGPLLTGYAVDHYLTPPGMPAPDRYAGLAWISLVYLGTIAGSLVLEFIETYLMQSTGQRAMFDLRREVMEHLQRLDLSYYDRNPVGRLVTRVTTDADALNELFASGLVTILGDLTMLSFVLVAMFRMSPGMTGLLLLVMPLVVLVTAVFRRTVMSSNRRIRIAVARINAYLQEHVTGMPVLQLFNRESRSREEFAAVNRDHMEAFKDSVFAYGWFYPVVEFLSMLTLAGLLAYGGYQVRSGALTLGVLVAFFQYGLRFFRPIQDLSEKYTILQSAMAAAERIFGLLDTPVAITVPRQPKPLPNGPLLIEFDRVWFAYNDEDWVIRDLSFTIQPGETIAVVGHTGAGKTTLSNLLLRFYDVQRGVIRIGGIDVKELDPIELRRHFAVVLQDPFLFTGTIGSNIRLGTDSIPELAIRQAAERVKLSAFVESLPQNYDFPVRERGNGLSAGQKQLISFARALAHNPQFLILDEATSSVDTETEIRIQEALDRLLEHRTSLIVAHRLSTIQKADRIFVMHKGQLRESGTHQQLLVQRGIYYKLYQLQYKDQELSGRRPDSNPPQTAQVLDPAR